MIKGISSEVDCSTKTACFVQQGFQFVGRYYGPKGSQSKTLISLNEARALSKANLKIAVFYEGYNNAVRYFNGAIGYEQGKNAYSMAVGIGQPSNSAIYFCVDYNASDEDIRGPISEYFDGVKSALEECGGGKPAYVTGIYGSGAVCQYLRRRPEVLYSWLADATLWAGTTGYTDWTIRQNLMRQPLCGLQIKPDLDDNDAELNDCQKDDFGGFVVPVDMGLA